MGIVSNHSVIVCLTEVQLHVSREDAETRLLVVEIGTLFPGLAAPVEFDPRICGELT
jgi:hypothetical protein